MQYIERTLQVKTALLKRPDFLERMRVIFASHVARDGVLRPIGIGSSRAAYEVGECEVVDGIKLNLLLKLNNDPSQLKYSQAAKRSQFSECNEFGSFEMYYDFVAGHISAISFKSKKGFEQYSSTVVFGHKVKHTFTLAEHWGGTKVEQGDMGAIPYFQLAIRYQEWFGQLTEGQPPLINPKYSAEDRDTMDDYTVEHGRIIDLGATQCLLIDIDRGGGIRFDRRYPGNLGVRRRGEKYFHQENRLDI